MRLIDKDAIKADLERQMDINNPNWSWTNASACNDFLEYLDRFPTIDTVKLKLIDGDELINKLTETQAAAYAEGDVFHNGVSEGLHYAINVIAKIKTIDLTHTEKTIKGEENEN